MTGNGEEAGNASHSVGGPARHIPVMLDEVLQALSPASGEVHVDGTFGAGGYTAAILATGASVIAIDRDPTAIAAGRQMEADAGERLMLVEGRFSQLDEIAGRCGHPQVDGVVLDIGVSSMQIDEAERGFSFQKDGPLDMRMEGAGMSAADVVNTASHGELARIFSILGEERHASRIARAIIGARDEAPFTTTLQLANLVERTIGRKPGDRIHPATRTFQALRIHVNRELGELADALFAAERVLKPGGRLVVVSFHSLEDRLVKRFLDARGGARAVSRHLPASEGEAPTFETPRRSAISAGEDEAVSNPRARSARLRVGFRTQAPAREADPAMLGLPVIETGRPTGGKGAGKGKGAARGVTSGAGMARRTRGKGRGNA